MPTLYDRIGSTYARSRRADPALAGALARLLALSADGAYLDLACGTGNYTVALSDIAGSWSAVDVSAVMLAQAVRKSRSIAWAQSSADRLPFASDSFDGAICTLAVHHFRDLDAPFAEVRRTLRLGTCVIFTGLAEQMCHYGLCDYFPQTMARSIETMPTEAGLRAALSRSGFKAVTVTPFFVTEALQDLFLYAGKHRPALYLDPAIRANISSFAHLAPAGELQQGLQRLAADLQRGAFASVRDRYETAVGDYAFVSARADG